MPLLLNIDTATELASVCLSDNNTVLASATSEEQKNHASFIQPAIERLMKQCGYALTQLDAIAVTAGPGSYTGLRVGLSTAKGLCYALNKPLIMIGTLDVMAFAAQQAFPQTEQNGLPVVFCPMIDARRMEVFAAVYDARLHVLQEPAAVILDEKSFNYFITNHFVVFSGAGCKKFQPLVHNPNSVFLLEVSHNASHLSSLSYRAFEQGMFADLAYSEPFYLKEFFSTAQRP